MLYFVIMEFALFVGNKFISVILHVSGSTGQYHEYFAVDLTRFAIQAKGPDGKWTKKPLAYRESISVHRPPEICVQLVFKHIHAASGLYNL